MANKRISELTDIEDAGVVFNPSAAYIIIEQGGVTYKMRALGFGGASGYAESLTDSKSTSLYAPDGRTTTLTFDQIGINNTASAWTLNIVAENTENSGSASRRGNYSRVGSKKPLTITKTPGLSSILSGVNSYPISSRTKLKIGKFHAEYRGNKPGSSGAHYTYGIHVYYYVTIDCNNADKIVLTLSSDRNTDYGDGNGSLDRWNWDGFAGIRANISASIQGTISS